MQNIDNLLKGDYSVNLGSLLQEILGRTISNNLLTAEVLRRVLILEKEQKGMTVDEDEINAAMSKVTNIIAEAANKQVNSLVATWHLKSGE